MFSIIDKMNLDVGLSGFKVLKCYNESYGDVILPGCNCPICKVLGVQGGRFD